MIKHILLRTLMMGGTDGIITVFNIISGIEGSKLNYKYIFILGLAVLISDAISMGTGEFISVKAEQEYTKSKVNVIPEKNAAVMFISFVCFGTIPLLFYFISMKINYKTKYINTYISVILALFILGVVKSKYTKEKWYISGGGVAIYGGIASFLAYNISKLISSKL
jgi:VIT1/CCC1 family predicted Fe2+/Mn2+ transporter